jgi:hypothetical protein
MEIKDIEVYFAETTEEEVAKILREMRLGDIISVLSPDSKVKLPGDLRMNLQQLLIIIADLFHTSLPILEKELEDNLASTNLEITLSRLFRERALFRFFQVVHKRVKVMVGSVVENIPEYMTKKNPNTGTPFQRQEEFIGWFCEVAHVSRSLVFQRMSTISKTLSLGFTLEEAYEIITSKPYAIRQVLNMVGDWSGGELTGIHPEIARRLAQKMLPTEAESIGNLIDKMLPVDNDEASSEVLAAIKPAIAKLLQEVADHDRVGEAIDFVRFDVLDKPEILYSWDENMDALIVEKIVKQIDPRGTEYVASVERIPFRPDVPFLDDDIRADIIRRLPIKNRHTLDIDR